MGHVNSGKATARSARKKRKMKDHDPHWGIQETTIHTCAGERTDGAAWAWDTKEDTVMKTMTTMILFLVP